MKVTDMGAEWLPSAWLEYGASKPCHGLSELLKGELRRRRHSVGRRAAAAPKLGKDSHNGRGALEKD
jgi:hypothetical protein